MHEFHLVYEFKSMNTHNETCSYFQISMYKDNISIFHAIGLIFISVSLLTNTVAILGTWKINSSCKSRSLKLLVCNFGIYFLLSVNIALVFTYPYLNRSIKKTFINAHLSTIILFVLLGSCFQGITAIDRYLIVRRGKKYTCWKNTFAGVIVTSLVVSLIFSLYIGYLWQRGSCKQIYSAILLHGCTVILSLLVSSIFNVLLIRYTIKHLSDMQYSGSVLKMKIRKTLIIISSVSVVFEGTYIILTCLFALSSILLTAKFFILGSLYLVTLLKCAIYPFIYTIRNYDIARNVF